MYTLSRQVHAEIFEAPATDGLIVAVLIDIHGLTFDDVSALMTPERRVLILDQFSRRKTVRHAVAKLLEAFHAERARGRSRKS